MVGRPKVSSSRLQVVVSDSLHEKIEAYADMMGISMPEAARHLMIRGLEQVQLLVSSKNSAEALRRMTESFDRGLEMEQKRNESVTKKKHKKPAKKVKSPVRGLVTPAQSLKNETESENIKDMFCYD